MKELVLISLALISIYFITKSIFKINRNHLIMRI